MRMNTYSPGVLQPQTRTDLFRLLGDADRLRLYALCAEEELTISELAALLDESQPQVSRKLQPLRAAGLLSARKDGTRTYLKASSDVGVDNAILSVALEEGRRLCRKDKSLARVPKILREREENSRAFFDHLAAEPLSTTPTLLAFLPLLRPLLGEAAQGLCVDIGAGDGLLLPLLAPLFARVFAVDRSPARLAACARVVADAGLDHVRLLEGDASDSQVQEALYRQGGAAVVVVARTLHHAARPAELLTACARLLRPELGGTVIVVDYLPHDDESMRAQGDVWLGFAPEKLDAYFKEAGLHPSSSLAFTAPAGLPDSHLSWQCMAATVAVIPKIGLSEIH